MGAVAATVALAACGGGSSKTTTASVTSTASSSGGANQLQQSFVSVINHVSPEVVQISTPQGLGSGVVFDNKGDVVTNDHVVAGGGPYQVTDSKGHKYSASLVGQFAPDDLAVVHANGASLPAASFANSELASRRRHRARARQPARAAQLGHPGNHQRARADGR